MLTTRTKQKSVECIVICRNGWKSYWRKDKREWLQRQDILVKKNMTSGVLQGSFIALDMIYVNDMQGSMGRQWCSDQRSGMGA